MNDHITIKCEKCSKTFDVARLKLSPLWGKKIDISCKHCQHYNRMEVNAVLMSGKNSATSGNEPQMEHTIHLNPNDKSFHVAKLHVIANEYNKAQSFILKEGDYLIGRQTDDDAGLPNKLRIMTEDTKMSRSHCQITVVQKADMTYRYILTDLGSLNGTHLDTSSGNKKLESNEKIVIHPGDIVGLGYRTKIKLLL